MSRIAVVLFNLGGPDSPAAVLPFLRNLFRDPAILRVPALVRPFLAELIARGRAPVAREIYGRIGGRSPILPETEAQARALEGSLADAGEVRVFVAMRYWHPRARATAAAVRAFAPTQIVLLPLYPQFSTTTTESSFDEWRRVYGNAANTVAVGCYPREEWFVQAYAACIAPVLADARKHGTPRVLFSAHGLPQKIADAGDPYTHHVQQSVAAIARALGLPASTWVTTFQSRVGRLEWVKPSTEDEVKRAGADRVPLVLAPISFVSEHSETLVELDIELRETAQHAGVPAYFRAPTVSAADAFIAGLAELVRTALRGGLRACPLHAGHLCPRPACDRDAA